MNEKKHSIIVRPIEKPVEPIICDHQPMLIYSTNMESKLAVNPICRRCGIQIIWDENTNKFAGIKE